VKRLTAWLPDDPRHRWLAIGLLTLLLLERLGLIFGQPDLLHDLDAAELKHMDLALLGLPGGATLKDRLFTFLSGPENIHHGGYPVVSILFWLLSRVLGASLHVLRLVPVLAAVLAAGMLAAWLKRRAGTSAVLIALCLLAGAPLLFLKWTCTTRGGHTEAIVFAPLLLLLFEAGLKGDRRAVWLVAGVVGGFAVYFSYLAIPLVGVLSLGALGERVSKGGVVSRGGLLVLGGVIGLLPWILGLLVLDLPYLEATIHQSGSVSEAAEVHARGLGGTLVAAVTHLPHNLWPWTITRADAPAYLSNASDMMDFTPTALSWVVRAVILAAATLGLVAAFARRSPLLVAVALVPGLQYLFVVRAANPLAWPDIPHRYLVLVFPLLVASIGSGVHFLADGEGAARRRVAGVVAGLLMVVALHGMVLHASWMRPPALAAANQWHAPAWRRAGLGQVRLHEAPGVNELMRSYRGETEMDAFRGLALVFVPISDYYLLFRRDDVRPYPGRLFSQHDPLVNSPQGRRAMVRAAFDATALRAAGDQELLRDRVCSWDPSGQFAGEVSALLEEKGVRCGGR
jgi:hypothetical protein